MKQIKRITFIFICVFMLSFLTSCSETFYYNYNDLKSNICQVEIIYREDKNAEFQSLKILNEIESDKFLLELSKTEFKFFRIVFMDPPTLTGNCVKLLYSDNSYEIIGAITAKYNSENEIISSYNRRNYGELDKLVSETLEDGKLMK